MTRTHRLLQTAAGVTCALVCALASAQTVRKPQIVDDDGKPIEQPAKAAPVLKPQILDEEGKPTDKPVAKGPITASYKSETEARALTISVPAPRGQIVDRNGIPLAQNRVANYMALQLPFLGADASNEKILSYAHLRIIQVNRILGKHWYISDPKVLQHYKNRRWLPLVFSISPEGINEEVTADDQEQIRDLLKPGSGLVLQPAYWRVYPKGTFAAHIIGYTHKTRPLPTGPVEDGQPIFEETEGNSGLEKSFDKDLQGKPGLISILFNPDGSRLKEEVLRHPVPGNNVVTSIDYNLQKYAENALAAHTKGSAMVVMDVHTGDILAMASYPQFDPNLFIPGITADTYERLRRDPGDPLNGRAFQGAYPPASTFKVVVAEAGLESGKITAHTAFEGSTGIWIGDHLFHNWNKEPEGLINVVTAIKRSCNTWFYQAGLAIGAKPIIDMANRLGFGERTGIPLEGESSGFVPSDTWAMQKYGHRLLSGDIANLSIGQGYTLVTPLQAAQAMSTVADGVNMPQPRLVLQVQNNNDQVVQAFPAIVRRQVALKPEARASVVKGMVAVVNADNGTGKAAALDECQMAGKTGTAQWTVKDKNHDERHLAWFSGFLPANDPKYAYALVYEGQPGETVSGGAKAAPIVHDVFENFFKNAPPDQQVLPPKDKDTPKAIPVNEEDERPESNHRESVPDARPVPEPPPQPAAPRNNNNNNNQQQGIGGFFHRLFGGR